MSLTIKQCFEFYDNFKVQKSELKRFTFLDRQFTIVRFLKKCKKEIIGEINYAFYESDEDYLISFFSGERANYVHINSRFTQNYPSIYENIDEYENYLAIYATFGILINQSFQLQSLNDSKFYHKDFVRDMSNVIFYDEMFRLNLSSFVGESESYYKAIYTYGKDYIFSVFSAMMNHQIDEITCIKMLSMEDKIKDFRMLFRVYEKMIQRKFTNA
ncbi:hypothetical protein [Campylobacter upsaliensis]|uniref:hypothetical protein n=1 Tax=Campylobacter upsaliensis TaxID=28080 RepID=UPI002149AC22|nr:hypothetical protein [Campylobacter upsaliensis]MCR2112212.1 hypothetical protein [Campylobacter upsaliensis]